jgi:cell division protein ZipA
MENLRLILLVAGIIFILAIYLIGRQRRRNNSSDLFDSKEDLPEFSAGDWDELDEGVGEVRIVARETNDDYLLDDFSDESLKQHSDEPEVGYVHQFESSLEPELEEEPLASGDLFDSFEEVEPPVEETQSKTTQQQNTSNIDIIVLYILAKSSESLTGDRINSVAQANGLEFGRMNIFHRLDENGQTIFSMANMIEPGNFDPESIHDLKTSALTMFMQLSNLSNPSDDFDEMLRTAYHISEMLGASLCSHHRQPITQADAEYYRTIISEKENA